MTLLPDISRDPLGIVTATKKHTRRMAYVQRKGGAGKTTSVITQAAIFAGAGLRVRVTDCDPQAASATFWMPPYGDPAQVARTLAEVYRGDVTLAEATYPTSLPNFDIVPSYKSLGALEVQSPPGMETELRRQLDDMEDGTEYDVEMFDCGASLGPLTVAALAAADYAVVPVQMSGLDYVAQVELTPVIDVVRRRINPDLRVAAVLMVNTDKRTVLARDIAEKLRDSYGQDTLIATIPHSVVVGEAPFSKQPLTTFAPTNPVTLAYYAATRLMLPVLDMVEEPAP